MAFFGAVNTVTVYQLQKFHTYALLVTSGTLGLILSLIICPIDPLSQIFHDTANANYPFLILSAFLGVFGLLLCLYSNQILLPFVYSLIRTQEVVIAFIFQSFIECIYPSAITILGAFLVISGSLLIPLETYLISKIPCEALRKVL